MKRQDLSSRPHISAGRVLFNGQVSGLPDKRQFIVSNQEVTLFLTTEIWRLTVAHISSSLYPTTSILCLSS